MLKSKEKRDFMKEKVKKWKVILIALLTIIILCIISGLIYAGYCAHVFRVNDLSEGTALSREEIINLLQRINSKNNYYYSYDKLADFGVESDNKIKVEVYKKDNKFKVLENGELYAWLDTVAEERVMFMKNSVERDVAVVSKMTSLDDVSWRTYSLLQFEYIDQNRVFEYLGEKKVKDKDCVVVKTYMKNAPFFIEDFISKQLSDILYIDKETGIIVKEEECNLTYLLPQKIDRKPISMVENQSSEYRLDVVTDADVEKPNLSSYKIINK